MATTQTVTLEAAPRSPAPQSYELRDLRQTVPGPPSAGQDAPATENMEAAAPAPILKIVVSGYSFFISGVNDGTLGPLIPYILTGFGIGTAEVAIMSVSLPFPRASRVLHALVWPCELKELK
ncbi:hypothetical protein EsH8_III_000812 [Colletotrichum jinshuiense]